MKNTVPSLTILTCLLLVGAPALGGGALPQQDSSHEHAAEPVHDEALIRAIMADVASGWENADGSPFEAHYLDFPGARYVESGGQNEGLRDLIDHHVVPEGDSLSSLKLDITDVEVHFEGGFAWAIGTVELNATIASSGDELHRRGYETFLFRWIGNTWKVVHTHSSTRAPRRQ